MDSFSSSFITSIPQTTGSRILITYSSLAPQSYISSLRTEEKPQQAIKSSPTPTSSPTLPKSPSTKKLPLHTHPLKPKTAKRSKTQKSPPKPTLISKFLDALDHIINTLIDPPTQPSRDPKFVLSDNFAPVEELPPTICKVEEGVLPTCLDGVYMRNGPNPQFYPRGPYHLFDGDGMVHSTRISNGKATFCCRYVKTYKYMVERELGSSIFPNAFSALNGLIGSVARVTLAIARVLAGQYHPINGIGSANTSLALFGNKLYALNESDLPYELKLSPNGDIKTVGRNDFHGKLFNSMTAHPKVDPETKEVFAFRYGFKPPFLTFFRFDANGNKQEDVHIFSMTRHSFVHDFAITEKYAIFPEIQIGLNVPHMLLRGGSFMSLDPKKLSRIGVIPKYSKDGDDMKWFNVPELNIIHAINAWEEVDEFGNETIVVVAPNVMSAEHMPERMDLIHGLVEKIKINLNTGVVSRHPLSARNLDFAVINPNYIGKKNKYIYAAVGDPMPHFTGIVKLDLSVAQDRGECTVTSRMFRPGCYGGEPFFVATNPDDPNAAEDDGYLVSYVHDENTGESKFLVMDAKSTNLDVVASVKLPQRVPYGFHGLFVRDKSLKGL